MVDVLHPWIALAHFGPCTTIESCLKAFKAWRGTSWAQLLATLPSKSAGLRPVMINGYLLVVRPQQQCHVNM